MAAKVGRRFGARGLAGRTLSLRVRFSDLSVRSVQRQLARPSDDELAFTPSVPHGGGVASWHAGEAFGA